MKSFTDFDKVDEATKYVVHYTDSKGQHVNSSKAFDDKAKADAHAAKGNSVDKVGGKYSVKPMQNEAARSLARRVLESLVGEQAPVAPTIDRKYIKGTPEHKAYKATKKPINGHPTNVKEDTEELGEELYNELHEVLSKDATASDFIHDFVKSDDPKFANDSKKQRIKRALGAYYGQQKEEAEQVDEAMSPQQKFDFDRMMAGAMSRAAYNAKWKKPLKSDSKVIYGKNVKEEADLDEATPYYNKPSFLKRMGAAAKQERLAREKKEREAKKANEGWDPEQFGSDGSGAGGAGAGDISNKDKSKKKKKTNESYHDNRTGFGRRPREDDEYHVPDPEVSNKDKKKKKANEGWDPEQFGSDGSGAGGAGAGDVSNKDKKKKKTLREFSRDLLEYESDKSGRYVHTKGSYGKSYDSEKDDNDDKPKSTEKRGRGRPAGSKSGARERSSTGKSYGGVATHSLNLPNSNK